MGIPLGLAVPEWVVSTSGTTSATVTKAAVSTEQHIAMSIFARSDLSGSIVRVTSGGVSVIDLAVGADTKAWGVMLPASTVNKDLTFTLNGTTYAFLTVAGNSLYKKGRS